MARPDELTFDELVTLVRGPTFVVAARTGDIDPDSYQGIYHRDLRIVSAVRLLVDGRAPRLTASHRDGPASAHQVFTLRDDPWGGPEVVLLRRRVVGTGVRDEYEVRCLRGTVDALEVRIELEADFGALLDIKEHGPPGTGVPLEPLAGRLRAADGRHAVTVAPEGFEIEEQGLVARASAKPGEAWRASFEVLADWDAPHVTTASAAPDAAPQRSASLRLRTSATAWAATVESARADVDALSMDLPDRGLRFTGAGAPWFMALFGRDSLLVGYESLLTGVDRALDTLETLAALQGSRRDDVTLEQPGRILHELRTGATGVFTVDAGSPYYATVDAPPLFTMLLGEVHRWGADPQRVRALLPAARAAVRWSLTDGDLDGDGFVEYDQHPGGLENHGWKDSGDSMVHADGSDADGPIALSEVQAYLWAALHDLAGLEEALGDPDLAAADRAEADRLRDRFHRAFWLPDEDLVAMALDGRKRPLAVASSNMGHCLWTGILEPEVASRVAARLAARDLRTRWGLRTLGSLEAVYNPMGYHRGTVWPHDTALSVHGLLRADHVDTGWALIVGLLEAADRFEWRLPELFGGFDDDVVPVPIPYPVACSPQAWSAAAPLLLLRAALRLEPDIPAGTVHVAPVLPDDEIMEIDAPLATGRLRLRVHGSAVDVLEAPPGVEVMAGERRRG